MRSNYVIGQLLPAEFAISEGNVLSTENINVGSVPIDRDNPRISD